MVDVNLAIDVVYVVWAVGAVLGVVLGVLGHILYQSFKKDVF